MKNLYTESKYDIITNFNSYDKGCNLISNKEYKEWCKKAENVFKTTNHLDIVKQQIKEFKPFIKQHNIEKFKEYIKEFDEKDSFFKENLKNINILKELLGYCKKASHKIDDFINNTIKSNFLFIYKENAEEIYDIISKFNTNYIAMAYLLTKVAEYRNRDTKFEKVFNDYFIEKNEKGESEFYKDLLNYLERNGPDVNNKFDGVIHTIKKTSEVGLSTEKKFEKFLSSKNIEYIIFAGDFSFVDLMGVDLMIKDDTGLWIPAQVKTDVSHCKNNYRFCQNFCVAPNKDGNTDWIRYYYKDGKTIMKEF